MGDKMHNNFKQKISLDSILAEVMNSDRFKAFKELVGLIGHEEAKLILEFMA